MKQNYTALQNNTAERKANKHKSQYSIDTRKSTLFPWCTITRAECHTRLNCFDEKGQHSYQMPNDSHVDIVQSLQHHTTRGIRNSCFASEASTVHRRYMLSDDRWPFIASSLPTNASVLKWMIRVNGCYSQEIIHLSNPHWGHVPAIKKDKEKQGIFEKSKSKK